MDHVGEAVRAATARASHVRYQVLAVVCSLSTVTYLDRVCISGSAPFIVADLGLTPVQMGYVFSAFALAYAAFEVPSGWLGDRIGPRKVITRIVLWWSLFTVLTGMMNTLWMLVTVRFLFGAGEAGAYPNSAKVISCWMPAGKRGFAQGMMWMWARLGGAFAPALVVFLLGHTSWRHTFGFFGVVGALWAIFFWLWFRDTPREKGSVNAAELQIIQPGRPGAPPTHSGHLKVPWSRLLRSGNLWAIGGMYAGYSYAWWFFITWLPTYLKARGVSMLQAGIFGGLPLFLGAFGCVLGGFLTDYVVKRTGNLRNRRYIGFVGFGLGSLCMMGSVWVNDPLEGVVVIALASFFGDLALASCWATCLDVGGELAGTVSGFMNMCGNLGGFLSPIVTAFLVQTLGSWKFPIFLSGVVYFMGALLWLRIDSNESVLE